MAWWPAFLIPVVIGLSFALFRVIFPRRITDFSDSPLTEEERRIFRWWEVASLVPIFLFVVLLGFGWYLVLKGGDRLLVPYTRHTLLLVRPSNFYWMIPSLFLGIVSSAIPLNALYGILLRDRLRRYQRYCNERVGFDANRAFMVLGAIVVAGVVVFFLAGITSFTRFTYSGIEIARPLWFRTEFYPYRSVREIERFPVSSTLSGNPRPLAHWVIRFDDGTSWSTCDGLRDPSPVDDVKVERLVSRQSGLKVIERK